MGKITTLSWPLVLACYYFGQPVGSVLSGCRKRELLRIRQIVHYNAFKSGMKYQDIADLTGNHWEDVRNSIRQIKNLIEPINGKIQDMKLKNDIEILR